MTQLFLPQIVIYSSCIQLNNCSASVTIYGEFIEEEGKYLEPIGHVIKGLCCRGEIYISREHEWVLKNKDRAQKKH
jgi:hypothetical protein